jgi:predicted transcriptional regulator
MSKQQYRTEMGIISDILQTTMDHGTQGIIISSIARVSNLSYNTAAEKCQKLVGFGLMGSKKYKRGQIFTITEKGILFFRELQRFEEYIQALKIRI